MSKNWLVYKAHGKLERIKNDPSYEQINMNEECPMCEDFNWEIEIFGHKDTHGLEVFRFCWNCGHTEHIRRLLKI
jgi:hypothetical protein